jgi:hypothetical protein
VLQVRLDNQICNNVMHFTGPDGGAAGDSLVLAERLAAWWNLRIKPMVPSTCQMTAVIATDLTANGDPGSLYVTGMPSAGTNAQPQLPNNATVVMSLATALRGRSYRGRIYHIGLTENDVTANTLGAGTLADLLTAYRDLRLLEGAGGEAVFQLAVLSYYANNAVRATPVVTPVTEVTCDGVVDSQRRRLPKRGT